MSPATHAEIMAYRLKHGIREATADELASLTPEQRWHYDAAAHKPHGLHFEVFRHQGLPVRPLYVHTRGLIGFGCALGNVSALRPLPLHV